MTDRRGTEGRGEFRSRLDAVDEPAARPAEGLAHELRDLEEGDLNPGVGRLPDEAFEVFLKEHEKRAFLARARVTE